MQRRVLALLIGLATVVAGCSSGGSEVDERADSDTERPRASILPPADADGPSAPEPTVEVLESDDDGRIIVETADGQLFTMLPTGEDIVELTDPGTTNRQAAWAPDGSHIAWVQTDDESGNTSIAIDRYDRSDFHAVRVDDAPSYLYWDPSATTVGHLVETDAGLDLWVAEPFGEDGPTNRRLDRGEPYFFSWGPTGGEMLVHASEFRLDQIDLGETTLIIDEFPARFGAASWMIDNSLVFADIQDDEQFLVTTGASGEGRRPLVSFDGELRFVVSNAGNRVVMQSLPAPDEDPVVTASTQHQTPEAELAFQEPTPTPGFDDSLDPVDPIETGIPYVMGTFGGEPFALSAAPAVAMFASPDGQSVAWFERAAEIDGALILRVDHAGTTLTTQPFMPSDELVGSYYPRFDQYSQSHDFWSPSSNLFVYAGHPPGDSNDYVFMFDRRSGQVQVLTDGVVASFTHTPQAGGAASAL